MKRTLIRHAAELVTCKGTAPKHGREMSDIGIIEDGAVYIEDDTIVLTGTTDDLEKQIDTDACEIIDAVGKAVLPGFVDSHTHFLFAGFRADEFARRLRGEDYMSIMEHGGGINATVVPTRKATQEELEQTGYERLNRMLEYGVTTVEGKSGYGMDRDCELKMLRAMKALDRTHPVDVVSTFMGLHSVLPEWKGRERAYIDFVLNDVLPDVKKENLAEFTDVFTEKGVFNAADTAYYLEKAKEMGFGLKVHADEMFPIGGTEAAVRAGARSADHLLKVTEEGIKLLADSDTIATVLPCTAFCLKEPYAPARKLIDAGCAVALATDFNPGSCFTNHIPLLVALGCIHMNLSVEEVITALTINGAAALGRADRIGSIEAGKQADILFLKYPSVSFLPYHTAVNLVERVIKRGQTVYQKTR